MDGATTTESVAEVVNNTIEAGSKLGESAYVILVVLLAILVAVLVPFVVTAWQSREDKRQARELDREHKETIAKSHERTAEAICKLAENDSRSIECQQQIREQMVNLHIGQHATKGAVIEALTIAEERAPDERTRGDIGRIRKRLETHS